MRALLTVLILLVLAAPAEAARVAVRNAEIDDREDIYVQSLRYTAAASERNRLTVVGIDAIHVRVDDPGARLRAGRSCVRRGPHVAICAFSRDFEQRLVARLKDGGDRLRAERIGNERRVLADGGAGDDRLRSGRGDDLLLGRRGSDRLAAGAGDDVLRGGPGRDAQTAGAGADVVFADRDSAGAEVLNAGPGLDALSFAGQSEGHSVVVRPRLRIDGRPSRAVGIENLFGGTGDDVLRGDSRPNDLRGGGGDDRLHGGAGADHLDPGTGTNQIFAGAGPDVTLDPLGDTATEVSCGPGRDEAQAIFDRELLRPDCEILEDGGDRYRAQPLRVTAAAVVLDLGCSPDREPIVLRTPALRRPWYRTGPLSRIVARGRYVRGRYTKRCRTRLRLTDYGRALPRPAPVVAANDEAFPTWTFVLRSSNAANR